ncbi:MAG: hypothetical protein ACLR10_00935 [Oscillospiraceae bacterium]
MVSTAAPGYSARRCPSIRRAWAAVSSRVYSASSSGVNRRSSSSRVKWNCIPRSSTVLYRPQYSAAGTS